ncbi:MAG: hypothetical protein MASP_01346 [Candidatus Methanolliviera sp. GoM_asphalt]|nr:MAG: hypothetical protein MASP_01346 [Candidatus Methanolliviera sp. GoM_asphalt]
MEDIKVTKLGNDKNHIKLIGFEVAVKFGKMTKFEEVYI